MHVRNAEIPFLHGEIHFVHSPAYGCPLSLANTELRNNWLFTYTEKTVLVNKLLRNKIDLQIFQKSDINALSGLVAEIYKNQNINKKI